MKRKHKTRSALLALALSALAFGPAVAQAESELACSSLLTSTVDGASGASDVGVVKTEKLDRWQARPWARLPLGVALWVRAPGGTTAADLHNLAANCSRQGDERSALCVKGASIRVDRDGGLYVVRITSQSQAVAHEIQQRASN